jgi:hypothetical protein
MTGTPWDEEPTKPDRPAIKALIEIDRLRIENAELRQRLAWIMELALLGGKVVEDAVSKG